MNDFFVHNTAIVDEGAIIGKGTRIWHWSHIMGDVQIGNNCNIGENAFVEKGVRIGNKVTIKNNIALYTGVICEDDVFLGPNVVFTNVTTPRSFISRKNEFKSTIVRKGCSVGANSTIICGHTLGRYSMIGAGSVVTKDVPDYGLVVGNPARLIGYVCECGERIYLDNDGIYRCERCGKSFHIYDNVLGK